MFTEQEEKRLKKAADDYGPKYALAIRLLFFLGLRVSELVSLKVENFNIASHPKQLTVRSSKDGYSRDYDLPDRLYGHVESWLAAREPKDSSWLFPHKKFGDEHMSCSGVQGTFRVLSARAGIPGKRSVHDARHTVATRMAMAGDGAALIADRLRHRSVESSNRYIEFKNNRQHDRVMVRRYED